MSHSENKPKTTQTSSTSVTNLNVQDTEGVTIVGDGNMVSTTDFGSISAALDLGLEALRMGGDNVDRSLDFAGRGIDAIVDVNRGAFDFGQDTLGRALDYGQSSTRDALGFGGDALRESLSFGGRSLDANASVSRDAIREIAQFGGAALGEVSGMADASLRGVADFGRDSLDAVTGANKNALDAVLDAGRGVLEFARDIFTDSVSAQSNLTQSNLTGLTTLAKQTSESADDRVTRTAGYAFAAIAVVFVAIAWRRAA